jgi:hypothetical protein
MSFIAPILPDNSPFSPLQRAWLDGYLAALFTDDAAPRQSTIAPQAESQPAPADTQDFPCTIRHCRSMSASRSPPRARSGSG